MGNQVTLKITLFEGESSAGEFQGNGFLAFELWPALWQFVNTVSTSETMERYYK